MEKTWETQFNMRIVGRSEKEVLSILQTYTNIQVIRHRGQSNDDYENPYEIKNDGYGYLQDWGLIEVDETHLGYFLRLD